MEFSLEHLQPKERASFALRSLYETAGCRKYHMGRFEEYSLYQENRSFLSSEQVITFTDLDGRLLALKPDVTLSIAKTAQPVPGETLRYYYHENVYRPSAESHTFKEISQMGLEMLGAVGEAEVQQAVCLAAQSLAALGAEWVLEVSHMGYLFGLFDALGVPEAARAQLLEKLRQKNAHELRAAALAAGLSETAADALCGVLELSGGYAATLSKAAALCRNPAMTAAVAELTALAPTLGHAGGSIRLDLTLAGEMEYYNGLVFQGYLKALPRPLLKGGRYDLLLQKFTPGAGAIGFAVYLDEKTNTYVEPDVSVICDPDKLDDRGCKGAPDWIIEIVSPASRRMDYYTKLFKYRTAGVREYWIVDPVKKLVMVYDFENEDTEQYTFQDSIKVGIYEDLRIDFAEM